MRYIKEFNDFQIIELNDTKLVSGSHRYEKLQTKFTDLYDEIDKLGELAHSTMSHGSLNVEDEESVKEEILSWKSDIDKVVNKLRDIQTVAISLYPRLRNEL